MAYKRHTRVKFIVYVQKGGELFMINMQISSKGRLSKFQCSQQCAAEDGNEW